MYCVDLALGMDRWRALVNAVMKFQSPLNADTCLTENRLPSQEGLC